MKKSPSRRRRRNRGLNYGTLEPRQLLATTGFGQFDGETTVQTSLVANGNFEANDIVDLTASHVAIGEFAGWNASDGTGDTVSLVGLDDSPRGTVLHLDHDADSVQSIYQDVDTEIAEAYTLAFDLKGRGVADAADATTNEVRVLWDGVTVGTFRGISFWQTFTVEVTGGSEDLTRLEIQEIDGAGNDGIGPLLDNIRLIPVTSESLANGSFEENATGTVEQADLPAWSVIAETGNESIDVLSDTPSDGSNYLNLDRQSDASDILFTNVPTEAGARYFLSFDLRSGNGTSSQNEEVRVRWNDQWASSYRGDADWQSFGLMVSADSDTTRLVFREPGAVTGDGTGPFLDNVRLVRVNPTISIDVSAGDSFNFNENDTALMLGSEISATSTVEGTVVTGAVVRLGDTADFTTETIRVALPEGDGTGTQTSDDSGTLRLTGNRTLSQYVSILNTLAYENTSENPAAGARQISIALLTGDDTRSQEAFISVDVSPENDAPVVSEISDSSIPVTSELTVTAVASDPENDTLTWTINATGDAIETGDDQPSIDSSGVVTWTPAREGTATLLVRATDAAGLSDEQSFVVTVTAAVLDTGEVTVNSGTNLPAFATPDPAVGQTIAQFTAQTQSGETFNSIEPGVARIYSVFAHWCPFCQDELPIVSDWLETANLPDSVEYVAASVAVDSTRDNYSPAEWFASEQFSGTVIVDNTQGRLLSLLGAPGFPFLVAVDASGQVVERISGTVTTERLDQLVTALTPSA